jgi:nitrogenase molybdenum-iron protein NifN
MKTQPELYVSTTNACKLCKPLGACLAFRGVEGSVPFLHGSQGCATYMRRYIISHFREPMDIASSSLGEKHAIYGGGPNLKLGLKNVMEKYKTRLIGIATTCLTETIGDDVPGAVREFRNEFGSVIEENGSPELVTVSTPSYSGTHMEGFHAAVRAIVDQVTEPSEPNGTVNLLPGFVSPADVRHLKTVLRDFDLTGVILPDISETLDGPVQEEYQKVPEGGTPIDSIKKMSGAARTIEFGRTLKPGSTAGSLLEDRFKVRLASLGTPIGLRETDRFFDTLAEISGKDIPQAYRLARGRLVDSYIDGHKYAFGKRAVVYGEEDLVVGLTAFLSEIGINTVLAASGGKSGRLQSAIDGVFCGANNPPAVREGVDFYQIAEEAQELAPDLLIGNSKGYHLAKRWGIPMVRVGFPIHDRFGGQRIRHIGYEGTQELFDRVVNALIEYKQENSPIGYSYI